jgi:hypothetical protein
VEALFVFLQAVRRSATFLFGLVSFPFGNVAGFGHFPFVALDCPTVIVRRGICNFDDFMPAVCEVFLGALLGYK